MTHDTYMCTETNICYSSKSVKKWSMLASIPLNVWTSKNRCWESNLMSKKGSGWVIVSNLALELKKIEHRTIRWDFRRSLCERRFLRIAYYLPWMRPKWQICWTVPGGPGTTTCVVTGRWWVKSPRYKVLQWSGKAFFMIQHNYHTLSQSLRKRARVMCATPLLAERCHRLPLHRDRWQVSPFIEEHPRESPLLASQLSIPRVSVKHGSLCKTNHS